MKTMYLKITEQCNMRCPFCYIKQNNSIMSLDVALDACDKYKPDVVVFHGGEPLLYPDLIQQIISKRPNLDFSITSNLTLPLTKERIEVLKKCGIATSYSADRFNNITTFSCFLDNLYIVSKFTDITLLVTLSRNQLKQKPERLAQILSMLPCQYVLLERLYEPEYDQQLAIETDRYILSVSKLIPKNKNLLIHNMEKAVESHTPVFSLDCNKNVITINPDGSIKSCPNISNQTMKKRRECLLCQYYEYCKGDCLSFQNGCMFPKKTFQWVLNGEK